MSNINIPELSQEDMYVLKSIDRDVLKASIESLHTYRVVLWRHNDTGKLMPLRELLKVPVRHQPLPVYPEWLKTMGKMFLNIAMKVNGLSVDLHQEGFFTENSIATVQAGTFYSPSLICERISDAYKRDRFFDGLFGTGVDNGLYLKMLLHLEDYLAVIDLNERNASANASKAPK